LSPRLPESSSPPDGQKEDDMSAGVAWFEIAGRDVPGLIRFYGDLFG
jgi:hypothetical protein